MPIEVPSDFLTFLRNESDNSVDTKLNDARATAIDFYQGRPFGDEEEGRSQAVTRDVSEVVDQLTVGILNTIISSGKAVEFETEPEPATDDGQPRPVIVDYGEQATAAVQYQFFRRQKGYVTLHDSLKAGLLERSGVVKSYVEQQPPAVETVQAGAHEVGEDGTYNGMQIVGARGLDDGWIEGMPALAWELQVERPVSPVFRDVAVPNEYFRVSGDATDLDEALCVGERLPRTLSDMVKMGYAREELEGLWGSAETTDVVQQARDSERSINRTSVTRAAKDRTLWLDEQYPLYDLDGDGIAERLFVHRIGNTVLRVMPVDEQPYSTWSPFPMQHRLIGESAADKTQDIQRIRSILLRQGLDSLYTSVNPRAQIDESAIGENTIDDWMTPGPQVLVRTKGAAITPLATGDNSANAFNAMEMISAERESRTGVTRQSQGINPDVLNRTASGLAMNIAQAQQIELYVARNFVEMLVASMFQKRYRLMRRFGTPFRMKIEGEYQTVDPRKWPEDIDVAINVGLGTGNRDQRLAALGALMDRQGQALQGGLRIFTEDNLYHTGRKFIAESGIGVPSQFITDPTKLPPAPEQPDPEAAKAQADAQTQQAKDAHAHEQAMGRLALQREEQAESLRMKGEAAQADADIKRERAGLESDLARDRAAEEARLANDRQEFEKTLAIQRLAFDQSLAKERATPVDDTVLPSYRPGGDLAE